MIITFTDGTTKQVLRVVFNVILGRSMIGLIETENSEPLFQCVEEIEKIEDTKKFKVKGTCIKFGPEDNFYRIEVIAADNANEAETIFKQMHGAPFGIDPNEISIEYVY